MESAERSPGRDLIYISYSRQDDQWQRKLRKVLGADSRLSVWDDTEIPPGADWEKEIREHVARARVMIMLVSPDYLLPTCGAAELEIKPALEAAKNAELIILWIPVRASSVNQHPIGKLVAAHDPAKPLEGLPPAEQEKVWIGVRDRISGVLGIPSAQPYLYDAFISYRHEQPDKSFVWQLVRDLEAVGFRIALDARDFSPQATFLEEMERCVKQSRFTLVISSPRYFQSGNTQEEAIIAKVLDMAERRRRIIPLTIEETEMPVWLYGIVGINFTDQQPFVPPMDRLVELLHTPIGPKTEPRANKNKLPVTKVKRFLSAVPPKWLLVGLLVAVIGWFAISAMRPKMRPVLRSATLMGNVALLKFQAPALPGGYTVVPQFSNNQSFPVSPRLGKSFDTLATGEADVGLPAGIKPPCWVRLAIYDTASRKVPNSESEPIALTP